MLRQIILIFNIYTADIYICGSFKSLSCSDLLLRPVYTSVSSLSSGLTSHSCTHFAVP